MSEYTYERERAWLRPPEDADAIYFVYETPIMLAEDPYLILNRYLLQVRTGFFTNADVAARTVREICNWMFKSYNKAKSENPQYTYSMRAVEWAKLVLDGEEILAEQYFWGWGWNSRGNPKDLASASLEEDLVTGNYPEFSEWGVKF